jgi:hypothetical protein
MMKTCEKDGTSGGVDDGLARVEVGLGVGDGLGRVEVGLGVGREEALAGREAVAGVALEPPPGRHPPRVRARTSTMIKGFRPS